MSGDGKSTERKKPNLQSSVGGGTPASRPAASEAVPDGLPSAEESSQRYGRLIGRLLVAGELEPFMLAVTSAMPGEGVSSVCLGLASGLAASTVKDVALLDMNLRRPSLHALLGLAEQPGLHEVVEDNEGTKARPDSTKYSNALMRTVLNTSAPNLWLVPGGARMANPSRLTTSDGARAAMKSLRTRFDYTIVDCPPVLDAVDAVPICRSASAAVIVMRAGITPREQVKRAQDLLKGVPVLGIILNGV